jgi:TatD DNase family protein
MLVDTHCHLDDQRFAGRLPQLLKAAARVGVHRMVVPGVEPAGWDAIASLGDMEGVAVAYGVHPRWSNLWGDALLPTLRSRADGACAVGEIGLDYQGEGPPRLQQQEAFRAQLRLAVGARLPVLLHCRHAFRDLLVIMRQERVQSVGGIMHAFSGSLEVAEECISLGLAIGVAGPVTWGNARRLPEVVRRLPLQHLVLETDSPDLTPEPHRGSINEPAFLPLMAQEVAMLKGITVAEVARTTTETSLRILGLHQRNLP